MDCLWPDKFACKLRTSLLVSVTDQAAPLQYVLFGNNVTDPFNAVGAVQPGGLDQLAAMYYKVCETSSAISARLLTFTAKANAQVLNVYPSTTSTASSTYTDEPYNITSIRSLAAAGYPDNGGANVYQWMSTDKVWGDKRSHYEGRHTVTVTPPTHDRLWYWIVTLDSLDDSNLDIYLWLEMSIYCVFTGRVPVLDA